MVLLKYLADIGSFLASGSTYVAFCILLLFCRKSKFATQLAYLVLFTVIYNYYLKSIWQLPLPLPLKGWAYPSGHMHSAMVFWGWLAVSLRNRLIRALMVGILIIIGFSLIYHGYHYFLDVLGAVCFGSMSLLVFNYIKPFRIFNEKSYQVGLILSAIGLTLILNIDAAYHKQYIFNVLGLLMGITLMDAILSYVAYSKIKISDSAKKVFFVSEKLTDPMKS